MQLGGSEPAKLAEAARIAADFGYDEINLNVGCPSDRVQSGTFGACLMREPATVAAVRRGDEGGGGGAGHGQVPPRRRRPGPRDRRSTRFADAVIDAGADALFVHARKAWLQGLSPKENREVPPLDYDRVYRLKARLPEVFVGINGGIAHARRGRGASRPCRRRDARPRRVSHAGRSWPTSTRASSAMPTPPPIRARWWRRCSPMPSRCSAAGGRLSHVTRHMLGLFHGRSGRAPMAAHPVGRCGAAGRRRRKCSSRRWRRSTASRCRRPSRRRLSRRDSGRQDQPVAGDRIAVQCVEERHAEEALLERAATARPAPGRCAARSARPRGCRERCRRPSSCRWRCGSGRRSRGCRDRCRRARRRDS